MNKKYIPHLVSLVLVTAIIPFSTFAWFSHVITIPDNSDKEFEANALYYGGGDGSESDPFIISDGRHLYNLAWLQDLGFYDDDNKKYFKVTNDIDMTSIGAIPPIGIDDHPFVSSFDGDGKTISNLTIDTSMSSFVNKPSNNVLAAHTKDTVSEVSSNGYIRTSYIGMFGQINTTDDSKTTEIKESVTNFNLHKCEIKHNYSEKTTGIIAGYVDGNLSKVGVSQSKISVKGESLVNQTVSKYTLIGDYHNDETSSSSGVEWLNKPGQQGKAFGGSLNFKILDQRLNYMQTRTYSEVINDSSKDNDKTKLTNQFNIFNSGISSQSSGKYSERNDQQFNYNYNGVDSRTMYFFDGSYFPINVDLDAMGLNDTSTEATLTINVQNRNINSSYSSYIYEKVADTNTGYFVGGKSTGSNYGMIDKINTFNYSASTEAGAYKSLGITEANRSNQITFDKNTNKVSFLSVDTNGNQFQILDSTNSSISILNNQKTVSALNYKRYDDVKSQFIDSIDGQKYFHGIHFYRTINTNSLDIATLKIPDVNKWDETTHSYKESELIEK